MFADGTPDVLAYPRDRAGWGRLCRLLTLGNLRAEKGDCILRLDDLLAHVDGLELVVLPSPRVRGEGGERRRREPDEGAPRQSEHFSERPPHPTSLRSVDLSPHAGRGERKQGEMERLLSRLRSAAAGRVRLAASMLYRGRDRARLNVLPNSRMRRTSR